MFHDYQNSCDHDLYLLCIWITPTNCASCNASSLFFNSDSITSMSASSRARSSFRLFGVSLTRKVNKCNQCEYETRRASSLLLHKKMHPGENMHICTLCDFSGITSGKLKVYMMRKHIREKPYKCKQCNYACPVSGDLQQHMKTHTVERPFKCNQCNKTYKIKGDLTRHCRAHQTSD